MRGLVILLLLPLFLGDSTPELVSDSSEIRPTCEHDSDCKGQSKYNCCIDGECFIMTSCCHSHRDCDTNCCILNNCAGSSLCKLCLSNSHCDETNCCKDYECVASSECSSFSALTIFIIIAVVVIIASAGVVFGCIRRRTRYSSIYNPSAPYIPPPAYVH